MSEQRTEPAQGEGVITLEKRTLTVFSEGIFSVEYWSGNSSVVMMMDGRRLFELSIVYLKMVYRLTRAVLDVIEQDTK